MTRAPDFLICGGQRCGSTSLAMAIDEHQKLYVAKPLQPEPKFFVTDEKTEADFSRYKSSWFGNCDNDLLIGEKSTSYLDAAGAAERIKHRLPSVKLIFILRHPVERAISNYLFSKSYGQETLSIDEAFMTESTRLEIPASGTSVHPHGYLQRSMYVNNLKPYFANFAIQQMHFVLFEQLTQEFYKTMNKVFEFLEVEPANRPTRVENINRQDWSEFKIKDETLNYLFSHFQKYNEELAELIGKDLQHWNVKTELIRSVMKNPIGTNQ